MAQYAMTVHNNTRATKLDIRHRPSYDGTPPWTTWALWHKTAEGEIDVNRSETISWTQKADWFITNSDWGDACKYPFLVRLGLNSDLVVGVQIEVPFTMFTIGADCRYTYFYGKYSDTWDFGQNGNHYADGKEFDHGDFHIRIVPNYISKSSLHLVMTITDKKK